MRIKNLMNIRGMQLKLAVFKEIRWLLYLVNLRIWCGRFKVSISLQMKKTNTRMTKMEIKI